MTLKKMSKEKTKNKMTFDETNKDLEEKLKQFQCNHCGNCFKGLPCPQDDKLFKFWKEYYESKGITR